MTGNDWLFIFNFFSVLAIATPLLGGWMARVFAGERHWLSPLVVPVEKLMYRLGGVDPQRSMAWQEYLAALVLFNILGFLAVFALQIIQSRLPLDPAALPDVAWPLAFNTAASFMTNTNWQAYAGEATLSYFAQLLGLTVQNFLSAATGIAVFLALARGLGENSSAGIGNFWTDITRATVHVLLPLALLLAIALVAQGVVQSFSAYVTATTLEGSQQAIPLGPAASQIAIKQLGTNGGGFFGVNSAHPFENPTALTNFLELVAILLIPAALTYSYGKITGSLQHGWCLFTAMAVLFLTGLAIALWAEHQPNSALGVVSNFEGKELRFGVTASVLWSVATTAASNGSVNAMHSSMAPLASLVQMFNIMLGEVVFGGVGAGLYGMLMFVILTVFIAGLMVGRSPEYLGKKIEQREVVWAVIAVILPSAMILCGTALSCLLPDALASRANSGPHGFSEMLYAWTSASGNNGSAFAGLNADTDFYNLGLGLAMLVGRFGVIVPALGIAGSMAVKKTAPPSPGTFPTNGVTFVALLIGVIVIVGGLTFLPALTLGPVLEHFLMLQGRLA
ncbi:MAG TPA: potassium-transporting ATPase subunit KdpA [Candidatus Binatia bacterium]|nr:potassium-transporting ATPase subunit KdpA [Candidatus Binatia bacterium]